MSKPKKKSFALKLRNYFFTGVVVLIPIGFTLYLTKFLIQFSSKLIPKGINPNNYLNFSIPGIEILLTVIFITIVGGLSLSFLGKKIDVLVENKMKKNQMYFGRNKYLNGVIFNGNDKLIGQTIKIKIDKVNQNNLFGKIDSNSDMKAA